MIANRNLKKRVSSIYDQMGDMGYEATDILTLGIDPGSECLCGIAVGRSKQSGLYAVMRYSDWTVRKDQAQRGVELYDGTYQMTRNEAKEYARMLQSRLMKDYDWLDPRSGEPYRSRLHSHDNRNELDR